MTATQGQIYPDFQGLSAEPRKTAAEYGNFGRPALLKQERTPHAVQTFGRGRGGEATKGQETRSEWRD